MPRDYDYDDMKRPAKSGGEDYTAASPKAVYKSADAGYVDEFLDGGNAPHNPRDNEDWGTSEGGSLTKGLSHQMDFGQDSPEYLGLGTGGPNQVPLGPNPTPVSSKYRGRASRFG